MVSPGDDVESGLLGLNGLLQQILGLVRLVTAQPGELHPTTLATST
jgi:hypothetical protein